MTRIPGLLLCSALWPVAAVCASQLSPVTLTATSFEESTLTLPRYGAVSVYRPRGEVRSVVVFLSGDGGWELGVVDMARRLAGEGALVAGIDIRRYFASLRRAGGNSCTDPGADLESLSQLVQRTLKMPVYRHPILVGYSSGATVVYTALAVAPHGTFLGALSLGFCPDQDFAGAQVCRRNGLDYSTTANAKPDDHTLIFKPDAQLRDPWMVMQGTQDQVCRAAPTRAFAAATPAAHLVELPNVGHGYGVAANWWPQMRDSYRALLARAPTVVPAPAPAPESAAADATAVASADLPIYETPASAADAQGRVAVLLTGDGGWAGIDQDLAAALAVRGVPVAALSSVRYFWRARTPDETASDVARLMRHALQQWHGRRVLLVGYSFGADALPFVVNRLPDDLRAQLAGIALLGFSGDAEFEISVAGWLPGRKSSGLPTLPELARAGSVPTLCVFGEGESDSACSQLHGDWQHAVQVGSGHHFSGRSGDIAEAILALQ